MNGGLPDIGSTAILLGVLAQIFLARRLAASPLLNYLSAFLVIFLSFGSGEYGLQLLHSPPYLFEWSEFIRGILTCWCFSLIGTWVICFLRDRIPVFRTDRRQFLKAATISLCAAPSAALATGFIMRKDFHVKEVDIPFKNLPADLVGLKLLLLSDIHMGVFFTARDLERVVDASNNLRPDMAFVTGDLITTHRDPLDRCLLELRRLRSATGVWGCMGNHELFARVQNYTKAKGREMGIDFLRQEVRQLKFGQSRMNLVGVDYQRPKIPYLPDVEQTIVPGAFNVLLSHNPDVFPVAARKGFDLTLSGHTHGGQINLEILGTNLNAIDFVTPYTKGLYHLPASSIYVTAGLGTIGIPVRIGAPPEITLIRLCRS